MNSHLDSEDYIIINGRGDVRVMFKNGSEDIA